MDRSKKSNKNNKKFMKTLRIYPALSIRTPSTRQPSGVGVLHQEQQGQGKADNNKDGDDDPDLGF
jgi:hypothetical protein